MSSELLIMGSSPQSYTLDAWGQNPKGQLGENPHYFGFQQLTTGALSTENFVQVESCGFAHFALTSGGNLYGWGNSEAIGSGVFLNYVSFLPDGADVFIKYPLMPWPRFEPLSVELHRPRAF